MHHVLKLSQLDRTAVADQLQSGALLLAPSSRLALDWKRRLLAGSAGSVCETPTVSAWQAWIAALTMDIAAMPVALNRIQERCLWERIIGKDLADSSPASLRGLAGHAIEAYALMRDYQVDLEALSFAGEEAEALARWINLMQAQLAGVAFSGRMLSADIAVELLKQIQHVRAPESILLVGFDTFTPIQRHLFAALQRAGTTLMQVNSDRPESLPVLFSCCDEMSEYRHVARRIQRVLDLDPQARIAVATSAAITDESALKRVLDDALMPEARLDPACSVQAVSMAGKKLTEMPMIKQLMQLLSLAGGFSLSFQEFSQLLFSPWLKGFHAEHLGRAALDARLRQYNRHRLNLKSLAASSDLQKLPALLSVVQALMAWNKRSRSANAWVKAVHELLKSTGFVQQARADNGQRNNQEIRQMNAFRDVLISLVAADAVMAKISWTQFLALLRAACADVQLADMAKYGNVEVLPLAQMNGLAFDHVMVVALDGESFPPAFRPQPMLPATVQMKYGMPMSSGALVYETAQKLWQQLLCSAPSVEISFALQRGEKELLPSSFVAGLELLPSEDIPDATTSLPMAAFDDESEVPLTASQSVKGGTSIIRNQSACPFRAFVTHRLGITALGETSPGIEASSKGSLIHLALEYIWHRLQTQTALAGLNDDELIGLIDAAIEHAWNNVYVSVDDRTRGFEQKRMAAVLTEWLALELERPDFKVVAIEEAYVMRLPESSAQQFEVNIKADRMDVDESGRRVLIDYKTGAKQSTAKWLPHTSDENDSAGERIEEPQLPQYALAAGLGVGDAVAFARVRSGDMAYEGLCGDDIGIRGIVSCDGKRGLPDDWQAVLDEWKSNINALATEFVEGRCDVAPRDAAACNYCGFEAICRIDEMSGLDEVAVTAVQGDQS